MAKIPIIPGPESSGVPSWLKNWTDKVLSWWTARDPTQAGDPLDKFVDRRSLVEAGVLTISGTGAVSAGGGVTGPPGPPGLPGPPGTGVTPDLTAPLTPTGFAAVAGIFTVTLTWDAPTYTEGHGHDRTNLYGAIWVSGDSEPTFSDPRTKLIDSIVGPGNVHSYPSQAATTWCFWLTFVTNDGVESPVPAGGVHGVQVTTGQDVDALLEILTNSITESQLYSALGARINLIDGSGAGSVNARIAVETSSRTTLDGAVHSLYTVRAEATADGRTVVGGFGLAASGLAGEGPRIDFGVRADQFWVAAPAGTTGDPDSIRPFVIRTTTSTENGVTIPPGVYMDAAYIVNLTASYAKIAELVADQITAADILVSQLTAGNLQVGSHIRSTSYVFGTSGWAIEADGFAEFNNGNFRGNLAIGGTAVINGNNTAFTTGSSGFLAALLVNSALSRQVGVDAYGSKYGLSGEGILAGVLGTTTGSGYGVEGYGTNGVYGHSTFGYGVRAASNSNYGVFAESQTSSGVYGYSTSGSGVQGFSSSGYGGRFSSIKSDAGIDSVGALTAYGVVSTNAFVEAKYSASKSAYLHAPSSGGAYFGHWDGSSLQWSVYSDSSNNTTVEKLRMNNMTVVTPGSFGSDYVEVVINGVTRKLAIIP